MTDHSTPFPPASVHPVHPAIEEYLRKLARSADQPVLLDMEALASERGFPIVGRLCGQFLNIMALSIGARRIFEFGSGFGYSAHWFASAVGTGGQVICTEGDAENADRAHRFLEAAGLWDRVDFRVGLAQDIFGATEGDFDICYNDVDKGDYPEVWTLARDRIRPGGLYIADNVLWHGRVIQEHPVEAFQGWTEAIVEHNQMIFEDPDFDTFVNPTRDGVLVARRRTGP
jgi:predicted O-methyltransferase YrrM